LTEALIARGRAQAETLIAAARKATGLAEFGDPPLRPTLDILLGAILDQARLTEAGLQARWRHIDRLLCNRLRLEAAASPPVKTSPLVFIVGMPRSGTTKLHRMLARDPGVNFVPTWRHLYPVPLTPDPSETAIRKQLGAMFAQGFKTQAAECYQAHPIDAEEPEEETWLMQHSFLTESVEAELAVPGYLVWLRTQDMRPVYRQMARFLAAIAGQHPDPGRPWILKGTFHGAYLDILFDTFPDARAIYCHRDPVASLPSYCSLVERLRRQQSDHVDRARLGADLLDWYADHQGRMMTARGRVPAGRILDLPYEAIRDDAAEVLRRISEFLDRPLDLPAMLDWEAAQRQAGHDRHVYAAADYGLDARRIADRTEIYRTAYLAEIA